MTQRSTLMTWALTTATLMLAAHTGCGSDDFTATKSTGGSAGSDGGGASGDSSAGTGGTGATGGTGGSSGSGATGGVAGAAGSADADAGALETINVVDLQGRPVADFDVISSLPDGSLFDSGKTDSQGQVVIDVPDGGSASAVGVTAVVAGSSGTFIKYYTVSSAFGIAQGSTSTLTAFIFAEPDPGPPMGDITVNVPNGYPSGTTQVEAVMPCNDASFNSTSPLTISGFRGCAGDTTYDVILLAKDTNGTLLGYADMLDEPLNPGQTATLTANFSTAVQSDTVTVDGFTSFAGNVGIELDGSRATRPNMKVWDSGNGQAAPSFSDALLLPGGTLLGKYVLKENVDWTENTVPHRAGHTEVSSTFPTSSSLHFPLALAPISSVAPPDVSKPDRPRFSWQLGSGTPASCSVMLGGAQRSATEILFWMAVFPNAATSYQLPELPAALSDNIPQAADTILGYNVAEIAGPTSIDECVAGIYGDPIGTIDWSGGKWGNLQF